MSFSHSKKRQYNATHRLSKKGYLVNGKDKVIIIYFSDITKLIGDSQAITLVNEFHFAIKENNQLKLHI